MLLDKKMPTRTMIEGSEGMDEDTPTSMANQVSTIEQRWLSPLPAGNRYTLEMER